MPNLKDRLPAALAHFGVPLWSLFLSLGIFFTTGSPFVRNHASKAFTFQCVYLPFHLFFTVRMAMTSSPKPLLICMGVALVLEIPQALGALLGRPALRFIPSVLRHKGT